MLKVRIFRAIDDLESCRLFAEGHANVLRDYGVTKVTSAKNDWFYNPNVYVVLVETEDGSEVVGGERIHLVGSGLPLPIEEAISIVENRIYDLVASYADNKRTGELCGLWNAKSIAGRGVSILLTKIGVALAHILKMDSLFVLCAPYTVAMCESAGFQIETSIGNRGTFVYPKLDLVATALVVKDMSLRTANPVFGREIFSYIENPVNRTTVIGEKGTTEVAYNLMLPELQKNKQS